MQILKVQLTSENIKNINSDAIPILPGPGVNKVICVHDFICNLNYNTTPFDSGTNLNLCNDPSDVSSYVFDIPVDGSVSSLKKVAESGVTLLLPNTTLYICGAQDSVAGDSTADVYVVYSVVDL